jgi:hypothetical protein
MPLEQTLQELKLMRTRVDQAIEGIEWLMTVRTLPSEGVAATPAPGETLPMATFLRAIGEGARRVPQILEAAGVPDHQRKQAARTIYSRLNGYKKAGYIRFGPPRSGTYFLTAAGRKRAGTLE